MQVDAVSVVSPYPFSSASQEEIDEREKLARTMPWVEQDENEDQSKRQDMSFYFDMRALHDREMECDDFSISSNEVDSLEDLGESFSTDPETFWEAPVEMNPQPTRVELSSSDNDIDKYPVPVIPTSTVLHLPELSC